LFTPFTFSALKLKDDGVVGGGVTGGLGFGVPLLPQANNTMLNKLSKVKIFKYLINNIFKQAINLQTKFQKKRLPGYKPNNLILNQMFTFRDLRVWQ
jgi:hypothetical protein